MKKTLLTLAVIACTALVGAPANALNYDTERDVSKVVDCRAETTTVTTERRNGTKEAGEAWEYGDWFTVFENTRPTTEREDRRRCDR